MAEVNEIFNSDEAKKIIDVGNAISKADDALLKLIKDSEKLIEILQKQNISFEQLTQVQKKAAKTTDDIDKVGKQLVQSEERLNQVQDKRQQKIIENQRLANEEKKNINLLIRARQAEKGSIEQLSAVNAILEKRLRSVNLTTEEGRKKAETLRGAIDRNTKTIMANSSQYSKWKINVGNYGSALDSLGSKFLGIPGPISGVTNAFKTLKVALLTNPITAIITAIVAAFALVTKALSRFQPVMDQFNIIVAQGKAVLDVILDRIGLFGSAIGKMLSGNWKEGFSDLKESWSGVGEQTRNATKAAREYQETLQQLKAEEGQRAITIAKNNREIENQLTLMRNVNLSDQQRINAAKEIERLESENLSIQQEAAKQALVAKISAGDRAAAEELLNNALETGIALTEEQIGATITNRDEQVAVNKEIADFINLQVNSQKSLQRVTTQTNSLIKSLNDERIKAEIEANKAIEEERTKHNEEIRKIDQKIIEDESKRRAKEAIERETEFNELKSNLDIEALEKWKEINLERAASDQAYMDSVLSLEEQKRMAKMETLDIVRSVFGEETAIGKIATAIQRVEAIKQNLISLGVITAKQAEGVAKSAAAAPFPFNLPLIAGTVAQFVSIFSLFKKSKVQGFWKGTENAPGKFIAGERGRELMMLKTGELMMVDTPTYFEGNKYKGATIKSNPETEKIISKAQNSNNFVFDTADLKNEMRLVRLAIEKKPISITDKRGSIIGKQSGNYREIYLNKLKNGR